MAWTETDRNGLEVLERDECLRLLADCWIGRIAITSGALPTILPVNFRLVGDRVVFRTTAGSKLDAATRGAVVAFEVDHIDPVEHTGWSVVVTGIAERLPHVDATWIARWAPEPATDLVAISTELVSGRRLR